MNINYQWSPKIKQFITAKISGNVLKQGSRNALSATSLQFTTAKIRSEGMRLGWRTPMVDGWKLVKYTRIENAHRVCKKIFVFYNVSVIYNY